MLHSTAKDSAVSARSSPSTHQGDVVTTLKNTVDHVVTEWGVAELRGRSIRERARALIAIAHPDHHDRLLADSATGRLRLRSGLPPQPAAPALRLNVALRHRPVSTATHPVGVDDQRVDVEVLDLGAPPAASRADALDHIDHRVHRQLRATEEAVQQRRQAQALDGPSRLGRPDWRDECDLGESRSSASDASGAHDDDRAERGSRVMPTSSARLSSDLTDADGHPGTPAAASSSNEAGPSIHVVSDRPPA